MDYLNPNTALRTAYLAALAGIGIPGWAKKIPKDIKPIPDQYYLVTSQTLNPTERKKDCFEWLCTIVIDVIFVGPAGYVSPVKTEDIEAKVITAVENGINVIGFDVKSIEFIDSVNLDEETESQSIERRAITYQHWLCQA